MIRAITPEDLDKAAKLLEGTLISEEPKDYHDGTESGSNNLAQMAAKDAEIHNGEVRGLILILKAHAKLMRGTNQNQMELF